MQAQLIVVSLARIWHGVLNLATVVPALWARMAPIRALKDGPGDGVADRPTTAEAPQLWSNNDIAREPLFIVPRPFFCPPD
jgi:hypothetical protein